MTVASMAAARAKMPSLMACLLEGHVRADDDGPDTRVARIIPTQVEIAVAARTHFRVVPGIARGGEDILRAEVETQVLHTEMARPPRRQLPLQRDVLQPDERTVLDPPRRHDAGARGDADAGHRVRGIRRTPIVQDRGEHIARPAGRLRAHAVQVYDLEVQRPSHGPAQGEPFVRHSAGDAEQVAGDGVSEGGAIVVGVDLAIAVQVLELLAAHLSLQGSTLIARGDLRLTLEDPVEHVTVEVAERLPYFHDRSVADIRQGAVRTGEKELMVPAQVQYLVAIERERSTEAHLHGPRGGTRVERQLESPVPDLPDVRDIVVEAGEVREEFVVEQVACSLVVCVGGETDPVIE